MQVSNKITLLLLYATAIITNFLHATASGLKAQNTNTSFHKPSSERNQRFLWGSCYKEEKIWVPGYWHFDRTYGKRIWIAGRWEIQKVFIPCSTLVAAPFYQRLYQHCGSPILMPHEFEEAMLALTSCSFESTRLALAKEIISTHCITTAQVRDIMLQFTFESSRLEIAKFAFPFTLDKTHYPTLKEVLEYPESIAELQTFLASQIAQRY